MKKFTFLAGFLCLLFTNKISAQVEVLGTNDFGRIFDLTYSVKMANTIYALTISRHIVVSNDNGVSWSVFYSLPPELGDTMSFLKISPDGSFLSFASISDGVGAVSVLNISTKQVTKTLTLPNSDEFPNIPGYNFFGNDINNLIVISQFSEGFGSANRVYITADGGNNWKQIYYSADNDNIITNFVNFNPADKNKIYIVNGNGNTSHDGGILISEDGGNSFTEKLANNVLSTLEFNPKDSNEIYIGTGISFGSSPENIFHSADGGNTFTTEPITWGTNGILNNIIDIKFDPFNNKNIIVLEEDEIVFSKDGGLSWESKEYPFDNLDSYYYGTKASYNPFKKDEIAISANYKPLFSNDNAVTLTQIKTPFFSSTGSIDLFENSSAKHLFYNVQSGLVHRNLANNQEEAFDIQNLNIFSNNKIPAYFPDNKKEGRVYSFKGGFSGSALAVSDDFGANSTIILDTFSNGLTSVITDPQVINQVWATFNNFNQGELQKINFNDLNNIVATNINLPEQEAVYKIFHPNNISNEFFILIGANIYKTIDGGDNWSLIPLGTSVSADRALFDITQDVKNPDHLALGTSLGVFTSLDKGETWQLVSNFIADKVEYSDVNSGVLFATTYSGQFKTFNLFYSVDNGQNWQTVDRDALYKTQASSVSIDFSDKKALIYIASGDLGLLGYSLNFETLASTEVISEISTVAIYPNPAVDQVHISAKNLKAVYVYDISGKKLFESRNADINVSTLPKGIYIVQIITTDNKVISKKLIKN